jgi:hypothetical protein
MGGGERKEATCGRPVVRVKDILGIEENSAMVENVAIVATIPRSCESVMRSPGFGVKRPEHMAAVDVEIGRSLVRMAGFLVYARNVISLGAARFGCRTQMRFKRMIPRDQRSS